MSNILLSIIVLVSGFFLKSEPQRDSLLIGDRVDYGYIVKGAREGAKVILPQIDPKAVSDSLVTITPWKVDTLKTYSRKKQILRDLKIHTQFTSLDAGSWDYPSQRFHLFDGKMDTLILEAATFEFFEPQIDTSFVAHDLRPQMKYPLTTSEIKDAVTVFSYIFGGLLLILMIVLAVKNRSLASVKATPEDPAHIRALRKLDTLRDRGLWEPARQKEFYSAVTDTLREYISERYGVGALEMTSSELLRELRDLADAPDKELVDELSRLFERADFIKFAKAVADEDQNKGVVPFAVRFVTSTYQQELEDVKEQEKEA